MRRWALILLAAAAALHELGLLLLARVDLVERLLSPSGAQSALIFGAAAAFLVLRVALYFLGPGLLLLLGWASWQGRR